MTPLPLVVLTPWFCSRKIWKSRGLTALRMRRLRSILPFIKLGVAVLIARLDLVLLLYRLFLFTCLVRASHKLFSFGFSFSPIVSI